VTSGYLSTAAVLRAMLHFADALVDYLVGAGKQLTSCDVCAVATPAWWACG
jgi:hypothetical protein